MTNLGIKVDANRQAINALGEQTRERFDAVDRRFDAVDRRFDALEEKVNNGFTEMRGKFDATAAGQQQIVTLLNTLIGQRGEQP